MSHILRGIVQGGGGYMPEVKYLSEWKLNLYNQPAFTYKETIRSNFDALYRVDQLIII